MTLRKKKVCYCFGPRKIKLNRKKEEFFIARNEDHLIIPFECHFCVFWKLCGSNPKPDKTADALLIGGIKQAIVDSFWSQASVIVQNNESRARQMIDSSESVGLIGSFVYGESYHGEITVDMR